VTTQRRAAVETADLSPAAPPAPLTTPVANGAGQTSPLLPVLTGRRRLAAAGISSPAGGEYPASADGTGSPLAGSTGRTFTIAMPAGMELLNANDRDGHWARRRRVTAALRESAGWLARCQRIPPLSRAHVLAVYEPPDRRRRDAANLYPSVKACVDGLIDAGMLPDDDSAHLDGPDMRIGGTCRGGRLVLYVTELTAPDGAA